MLRNFKYDSADSFNVQLVTQLSLLNGLCQSQGVKGEVILMDIQNATIMSNPMFKESDGKDEENVIISSQVTNVNFVGIETRENKRYVPSFDKVQYPIEIIMPIVSYLTFVDCGYQPSDLLEWDGGAATLEDAFVSGTFAPLNKAIMQLFPDGIDQLLSFMDDMGIISIRPNKTPSNLQEVVSNEYPNLYMLDLLNQVALGSGIINSFPVNKEAPDLIISSESVQMMKEALRKSGNEIFAKINADKENNISGYTYTTLSDSDYKRNAYLFAYFPTDEPKFSVFVWLNKIEESEESKDKDHPELEVYAANVCKRIVDKLMNDGKNL